MTVHLLSGGAAHGLVSALTAQFKTAGGGGIAGTFGAVGAMRDKVLAGEPADLLILTRPLIDALITSGHVVAGSAADLGVVKTGVAVRAGSPHPRIHTAPELRAALLAADAVYFPDPKLATAGIHFAAVLGRLGIVEALTPRYRQHPNGAAAMQALAASHDRVPIGCTQVTEILNTPGTELVSLLPQEFGLATTYTLGIAARCTDIEAARRLAAMLTNPSTQELRTRLGFE